MDANEDGVLISSALALATISPIQALYCVNCETERIAKEAAEADLVISEDALESAETALSICESNPMPNCQSEENAVLLALADVFGPEEAVDYTTQNYEDCLAGPPIPPSMPVGEESVLASISIVHE